MKLTGKCKEDFENYVQGLEVAPYVSMLDNIPKCYLNALIIEFFDSVGIYVFTVQFESKMYCNLRNIYGALLSQTDRLNSRQEATNQAIIKANQIYNEK